MGSILCNESRALDTVVYLKTNTKEFTAKKCSVPFAINIKLKTTLQSSIPDAGMTDDSKSGSAVHFGVAPGSDGADFRSVPLLFLGGMMRCTWYVASCRLRDLRELSLKLYEFFRKTRRSFHSFLVRTPSALF